MKQYLNLLNKVKNEGVRKKTRTGIDAFSISGAMFEHDMKEGFPLLTTKKMGVKTIFAELEFFIKGIHSKKWLQERNCHIWDEWCDPRIVPYANDEATKQKMLQEDELGRIYGVQWNSFGAGKTWDYYDPHVEENETRMMFTLKENKGINQLKKVIETLKTNPTDRRMIVMAWNPLELHTQALPPCHYGFQLLSDGEYVDLLWNMRSWDISLGGGYNIASYAMLLQLICAQVNMKPRKLICFAADVHIYENQLKGINEQLIRTPFDLPTIDIIKNKQDNEWTIWDWNYLDFKLNNYKCHPKIELPLAV